MTKVVMVLIGNIKYDGRVRKEIASIKSANISVELIVTDYQDSEDAGDELGIKIHYIKAKKHSAPILNFIDSLIVNYKASRLLKKISPEFVHCHDLNTLLSGVLYKKSGLGKLVYDAHELFPESLGGTREKIWDFIERYCISSCDKIIMPEKNRAKYFMKKYSTKAEIGILENFPRECDIENVEKDILRKSLAISDEKIIVLHTGSISPGRYVEELIDALAISPREIVLVLIGISWGGYDQILRRKIDNKNLRDRVFICPPVPHSRILSYIASCDIGTAFYRNTNLNNFYCASNKLYENIALCKPVLTNNYPGLIETVGKNNLGVCVEQIDAESLADAILKAIDLRSTLRTSDEYLWEKQHGLLAELYGSQSNSSASIKCRRKEPYIEHPPA